MSSRFLQGLQSYRSTCSLQISLTSGCYSLLTDCCSSDASCHLFLATASYQSNGCYFCCWQAIYSSYCSIDHYPTNSNAHYLSSGTVTAQAFWCHWLLPSLRGDVGSKSSRLWPRYVKYESSSRSSRASKRTGTLCLMASGSWGPWDGP